MPRGELTQLLRRSLSAFALCVVPIASPQLVAAQSAPAVSLPAEVSLHVAPCDGVDYDASELTELLRVELRELGVVQLRVERESSAPPAGGTLALIHVGCGPVAATLAIELADLVAGNRVIRELSVNDVPAPGRARALSIAIATLLESSWSLLAAQPVGAANGVGPAPMPESVRVALRRRLSANLPRQTLGPSPAQNADVPELPPVLRPKRAEVSFSPVPSLSAALVARSFPARGSGITGIDFAAARAFSARIWLAFDLEGMYGRQLVRDADTDVAELNVLWLSLGAALYVATSTEPSLMIGPAVRAAYARVLSSASSGAFTASSRDGEVFMFGLSSLVRFELSPRRDLFFGADIAYVPGGLNFRAAETRVISFADLALSLRLGVALRP